jgi:acyl-CoA-dependent ceramide synthase
LRPRRSNLAKTDQPLF